MSLRSPSTASVLAQIDSLGPPGTPVTIDEVAAGFDCSVERLEAVFESLVRHRLLRRKPVGDGCCIWWRPASHPFENPAIVSETEVDEHHTHRRPSGAQRLSADSRDPAQLYGLVFDQAVQFTGILEPDGTLIDANDSALRFGGLARQEVIGRPVWETDWWTLTPETQRRLKAAVRQAAAGETVRYEATVQGATRTVPIDFSLRPVDDGEATLLIAEGRDISDLKTTELELRQQRDALETELSAVLERVSDGVYSLDSQRQFEYVNDHAQSLLGIEESTVRGREISEAIETTEQFRTRLQTAIETQKPVFFEDYYEPLDAWLDNAIYPSESGVSVFFRDISERKRLALELQTETEHFQTVLTNSPVVAFRQDTDLRYTWIGNPREGFSEAEVIGKRDDELLPPKAAAAVMEPKQQALDTGQRVRKEVTLAFPDGDVIYDLTVDPIFDETGKCIGLAATTVDLTEQSRTKAALRSSEERLQLALQAGNLGTWELDLRTEDSPVRSIEHDRIFGYDQGVDDWSFEIFLAHVHPDDRPAVKAGFEAGFETGEWAFECRITRADGIERWIAAAGEFHTDDDGELVRAIGVVSDITDRMSRQRALEASEQRYRTLVANFPNGGVALLDEQLRHRVVDGLGFEAVGIDVETLAGKQVAEVFPTEIASTLESAYRETLAGEAHTLEVEVSDRTCEFRTLPVTDADGETAVLSIFHDITLRKTQQEQQLVRLSGLHEIVQDIAHLIIDSSTRGEIEQIVCDRFDDADPYLGAWVGRPDHTGSTIHPSAVTRSPNNVDSDSLPAENRPPIDLANSSVSIEPDAPSVGGPIAAAIETVSPQPIHTSPTDPIYAQWCQSTPIQHRPGVVVPVRHESRVYGVVVVYTEREAFEPRELETFGRLGRIVGHAINAIEQKRALIGGRATEVVVRSAALAEPFVAAADDEAMTISIDRVVTLQGGRSLIYYTIDGLDPEQFAAVIEELIDDSALRVLEQLGSRSRLELSTKSDTLHSVVAGHGGWITTAGIRDGSFEITIRVPLGTEIRPVLDAARTMYPDLRLASQTTVTPSTPTPLDVFGSLTTELTDRLREALEVGFYAGFFEWPRETTGDELAELMGVTPATIHHHLRHGLQKLLAAFFERTSQSTDSN